MRLLRPILGCHLLVVLLLSGVSTYGKKNVKNYPSVFNRQSIKRSSDTIPFTSYNLCPKILSNKVVVPVSLMAAGGLLWSQRAPVKEMRDCYLGDYYYHIDDYMQYAPGAIVYGLNALGIKGHHTVGRASLSLGMSMAIMGIAVNSLKYSVKEPRPDGSANNSFPSGHTAMAFTMATFLHKEYGVYRSPLYSMLGFALAGATGVYRVLNNKHWISDVMFGAGVGILSTEAGYGLTQCIMGDKGTRSLLDRNGDRYQWDRPHYARFYIGRVMPLGDLSSEFSPEIYASRGVEYGMKGAYFLSSHWGIASELNATSFWMNVRGDELKMNSELMGSASFLVGPAYSTMFARFWRFDADMLMGYWIGAKNKLTLLDSIDPLDGSPETVTWDPNSSFTMSGSLAVHRMFSSHFGIGAYARMSAAVPEFSMNYKWPVYDDHDDYDDVDDEFHWGQWSVGLSLTGYLW